ncbi:MBL fold metallo-hydrolase [Paenibacillus sp. P25]|nr:MBL fold metallo-hydrolase [Paenibacillus sp. P25]
MAGAATLHPSVTQHGGVLQVKVPLPFPLRWVNSYLLRGADGWTLIDPGLRTEAAEALWEAVLASFGIAGGDICRIVLTHHHPDHYGLAGWFQERSGAPVLLSAAGLEQVRRLWGGGRPMTEQLLALFREHGLPAELEAPMREHMDGFVPSVSPRPEVTLLAAGETVRLGNEDYVAIHTPGHAAGHLCLYRAETETMFCGDHVLPQISPNVSYLPGGIDENPLASYLDSLERISRCAVKLAFPGHREPFGHLPQAGARADPPPRGTAGGDAPVAAATRYGLRGMPARLRRPAYAAPAALRAVGDPGAFDLVMREAGRAQELPLEKMRAFVQTE